MQKEFKMEQVLAMWENMSRQRRVYLSGKLEDKKVIGFYNTNKKNPKEPDVRIYWADDENLKEPVISLWCNVSKNNKKYLSGKYKDKKLVGFINSKEDIDDYDRPKFSLYYSNEEPKKEEQKPVMEKHETEKAKSNGKGRTYTTRKDKKQYASSNEWMDVPETDKEELPF